MCALRPQFFSSSTSMTSVPCPCFSHLQLEDAPSFLRTANTKYKSNTDNKSRLIKSFPETSTSEYMRHRSTPAWVTSVFGGGSCGKDVESTLDRLYPPARGISGFFRPSRYSCLEEVDPLPLRRKRNRGSRRRIRGKKKNKQHEVSNRRCVIRLR